MNLQERYENGWFGGYDPDDFNIPFWAAPANFDGNGLYAVFDRSPILKFLKVQLKDEAYLQGAFLELISTVKAPRMQVKDLVETGNGAYRHILSASSVTITMVDGTAYFVAKKGVLISGLFVITAGMAPYETELRVTQSAIIANADEITHCEFQYTPIESMKFKTTITGVAPAESLFTFQMDQLRRKPAVSVPKTDLAVRLSFANKASSFVKRVSSRGSNLLPKNMPNEQGSP